MSSELQRNSTRLLEAIAQLHRDAEDIMLDIKDQEQDADYVSDELDKALRKITDLEAQLDEAIEALDWAEYELEQRQ